MRFDILKICFTFYALKKVNNPKEIPIFLVFISKIPGPLKTFNSKELVNKVNFISFLE